MCSNFSPGNTRLKCESRYFSGFRSWQVDGVHGDSLEVAAFIQVNQTGTFQTGCEHSRGISSHSLQLFHITTVIHSSLLSQCCLGFAVQIKFSRSTCPFLDNADNSKPLTGAELQSFQCWWINKIQIEIEKNKNINFPFCSGRIRDFCNPKAASPVLFLVIILLALVQQWLPNARAMCC